ncbi:MAG: hypothetical protein QOE35_4089 [Actinomycetota bacterium]
MKVSPAAKAEATRLAAERVAAARIQTERVAAEQAAAEQAAVAQAQAERVEAARVAAEQAAAAERVAAEQAAAARAAAAPREVATFSGSGDKTTASFTVGETWQLSWTVRANTTPIVEILDTAGGRVDFIDTGQSGSGSTIVHQACTCYLKVSVFGDTSYTLKVINNPQGA